MGNADSDAAERATRRSDSLFDRRAAEGIDPVVAERWVADVVGGGELERDQAEALGAQLADPRTRSLLCDCLLYTSDAADDLQPV